MYQYFFLKKRIRRPSGKSRPIKDPHDLPLSELLQIGTKLYHAFYLFVFGGGELVIVDSFVPKGVFVELIKQNKNRGNYNIDIVFFLAIN
jgi:hypothetical protein